MNRRRTSFAVVAATLVVRLPALGQCTPQWDTSLGSSSVEGGAIRASAYFDDGSGRALYVAGTFRSIGGSVVTGIARTSDGMHWEHVGESLLFSGTQPFPSATIEDMVVFDADGAGPQPAVLVVGGTLELANGGATSVNHVAAWNGTAWSSLGNGLPGFGDGDASIHVTSLEVFDSGTGPRLYAGGNFAVAGVSTADVAVWNGSAWAPLALMGTTAGGIVHDLLVHDDGTGAALYAAGAFDGIVGTAGTKNLARWNGTAWSSVGGGTPSPFSFDRYNNLVSFDTDGAGGAPARLMALATCPAGDPAATPHLDAWDGASWTSTTLPQIKWCGGKTGIAVFTDSTGTALYYGGTFADATTQQRTSLIRYDGTAFTQVGAPSPTFDSAMSMTHLLVNTLTSPPSLLVYAANGETVEEQRSGMLNYRDGQYFPVGPSGGPNFQLFRNGFLAPAYGNNVSDLEPFDLDGPGPQPTSMIAVGDFFSMGGVVCHLVAAHNGSTWSPVGGGFPDDVVFNGTNLGGALEGVTSLPGAGGNELFVRGSRISQTTGDRDGGVFRLSGGMWQSLGSRWNFSGNPGNPGNINGLVTANFGSGEEVYAFGRFMKVEGVTTGGVVKWDGASWSQVGVGIFNAGPLGGVAFNDGTGAALFCAGELMRLGPAGALISGVIRWDGATWANASAGLPAGTRPKLVIFNGQLWAEVGQFDATSDLYRWTDGSWTLQSSAPFFDFIRFIGVTNSDAGERFYFNTADFTQNFVSSGILEFDGATWATNTTLGRVAGIAGAVQGMNVNGSDSLWFAGGGSGFIGVGAENAPGVFENINAIDSTNIARWFCPAPPCPADFNQSGSVTVQDIFDFLAAFFRDAPAADFNHSGSATVQDIFDFLAAFFTGC